MRHSLSLIVVAALVAAPSLVFAQEPLAPVVEAAAFEQLAASIPIGTRVKVRTSDGRRMTATLMVADAQGIVVKRLARTPEPAVSILFRDLTELRRDKDGGMTVGKAIGIGLAAGAGVILTLFALAVAVSN